MDHKVSKDMISSGMIPSGEKTQADLGRTQYGSAPSPSSLMEAYRSIYEHHQKDKDGNTIPHQEDLNEGKIPAGLQAYLDKKKGKKEDKKEVKEENVDESILGMAARGANMARRASLAAGAAAARGTSALRAADARAKAAGGLGKMAAKTKIGQSAIAAGKGIKKTVGAPGFKGALAGGAIGGAVGAGLMSGGKKEEKPSGIVKPKNVKGFSTYDLNFDYTPEGDVISEDLFDALKSALIEEGCDEKNAMKIMASITPDLINEVVEDYKEEENIQEALPLLAIPAAKMAAGLLTKKAVAGAALKLGSKAAAKTILKKGVGKAAMQGAGKFLSSPVGSQAALLGGMQAMPKPKMPSATQQRAAAAGRRTAGGLNMDLDLFDVVKGKLLDEGLTEEESNDVMLTLTLEEINEVIQLDEISSKLLMKSAKAADIARGKAAVAGNKQLAIKKLKQGSKFFEKGVQKRKAEGKMGAGYKEGV